MKITKTVRGEILNTAKSLTEGDRNKAYGSPHENLTCYAGLVENYLQLRGSENLTSVDGAILNVLAKVSRVAANPNHPDNYVDMAAYAAIAGECAEEL